MTDWVYAQRDAAQRLARLHHFSVMKKQPDGEFEFLITVREYVSPPDAAMRYFAQADKQTNQKTAPFTPAGWGTTMLDALAECIRAIERFPYQGPVA
jgi:hypothetical protein